MDFLATEGELWLHELLQRQAHSGPSGRRRCGGELWRVDGEEAGALREKGVFPPLVLCRLGYGGEPDLLPKMTETLTEVTPSSSTLGSLDNGPGTKMTKKEDTQNKYLNNSRPKTRGPFLTPWLLQILRLGYPRPKGGEEAYSSPARIEIEFLTNPAGLGPAQI